MKLKSDESLESGLCVLRDYVRLEQQVAQMRAEQKLWMGDFLRNLRSLNKISALELASQLGIGASFLCKLEHGTEMMAPGLAEKLIGLVEGGFDEESA